MVRVEVESYGSIFRVILYPVAGKHMGSRKVLSQETPFFTSSKLLEYLIENFNIMLGILYRGLIESVFIPSIRFHLEIFLKHFEGKCRGVALFNWYGGVNFIHENL